MWPPKIGKSYFNSADHIVAYGNDFFYKKGVFLKDIKDHEEKNDEKILKIFEDWWKTDDLGPIFKKS